jgi:hypothetical protein
MTRGQGAAMMGLLLGGAAWVTTRPGSRRAKGAYGRGQDRAARLMAIPLLLLGIAGLVAWALGH